MEPVSVKKDLIPRDKVPEAAAAALEREGIARIGGMIYIRSGEQALRCEDGMAGKALIGALKERETTRLPRQEDPWISILNGSGGKGAPSGIRDGVRRCVILFEAMPGQEKPFRRETWDDLAPMERGDAAVETGDGCIALIKLTEGHSDEEITEFAAAVIETVETETGIQLQAGIGVSVQQLAGLPDSLGKAQQAIDTGRVFQPEGRVYCYWRLAMERMISAVPEETRRLLRAELLPPEARKQLNPEMMETIRSFFRNDLNLSTTARELFIHRNTLIYRLDKIRKETGFDLRRFQDAAVFRMISCIPDQDT